MRRSAFRAQFKQMLVQPIEEARALRFMIYSDVLCAETARGINGS